MLTSRSAEYDSYLKSYICQDKKDAVINDVQTTEGLRPGSVSYVLCFQVCLLFSRFVDNPL